MVTRRGFITGLAGILASGVAPAILPSGIIMPVKRILLPGQDFMPGSVLEFLSPGLIAREALKMFERNLVMSERLNEADKAILKITRAPIRDININGMIQIRKTTKW